MRARHFAVAVAAVAGALLLTTTGHAGAPGESSLKQNFDVFNRARTAQDAVPAAFTNWTIPPVKGRLQYDQSRLALDVGSTSFYLIPRDDGGICLVAAAPEDGSSLSCTSVASASDPKSPMIVTGSAGVYALIPDVIRDGTVTDARGTHPLRHGENIMVATSVDRPQEVTFTTTDGKSVSTTVAVEAPVDATDTKAP
jgi:hypothetical protein